MPHKIVEPKITAKDLSDLVNKYLGYTNKNDFEDYEELMRPAAISLHALGINSIDEYQAYDIEQFLVDDEWHSKPTLTEFIYGLLVNPQES